MASAYANLGDYERAIKAQDKAIQALPEDSPLTIALLSKLEEYRVMSE